MFIAGLGAFFFGLAVGWVAYRILRLRAGAPWLSDLIAMLGVIGGAAVLALFRGDMLFGWYSIGLILGFFAYFAVGLRLSGKQEVQPWLQKLRTVQHDSLHPLGSQGQKFAARVVTYNAHEKPEERIILSSNTSRFTLTVEEFEELIAWARTNPPPDIEI